jgi:hypothetical protein
LASEVVVELLNDGDATLMINVSAIDDGSIFWASVRGRERCV